MASSFARRFGAVLAVVVLLSVLLVPAASASGNCTVYHRVRRGENLSRIAAHYGVNMWTIARANHIHNIDKIYAGSVLAIPKACPPPKPKPKPAPAPCTACPPQPCGQPCPPPPPAGWHGEYFNNRDLAGGPVMVRSDPNLAFNWGWGQPSWEVPPDNFSVRWTKSWLVSGGTYRLNVRVDDGFRVFVDGNLVLESWRVQPDTYYCRDMYIPYGYHNFKVEFFEAEQNALISVWWNRLY
jgi:LysM repeat protein